MSRVALATILAAVLAGCINLPSSGELATADYGEAHTTKECIAIFEAYHRSQLIDGTGARYRHGVYGECIRTWLPAPGLRHLFRANTPVYGYELRGQVSAKNRDGEYTGWRDYWVLIRNGRVVLVARALPVLGFMTQSP